jgi:glycosyltransferase involved in cell wall biosynthesis
LCIALAALHGVPMRISHSHNTTLGKPKTFAWNLFNRLMRHWMRKHSTHLFSPSLSAGDSLYGTGCARDARFSVLHNAIDLAPFESPGERSRVREETGVSSADFVLGHIGRFEPQKNHGFLLDVLEQLRAVHVPAHLFLVGKGYLEPEIVKKARQRNLSGHVHMLGVRADVPRVLAAIDVFIFPSHYEGLGMVAVEAQAAGTPALTSDAVPEEADLKIGLLRRMPLTAGAAAWSCDAQSLRGTAVPQWKARKEALIERGYDVRVLARRLQSIYLSDLAAPLGDAVADVPGRASAQRQVPAQGSN